MTKSATQFTFEATLLATIPPRGGDTGRSGAEAAHCAGDIGRQPWFLDNAAIVVQIAIEGDLDLIEAREPTRPQHGSRRRPAIAKERR